MHQVQAHQSCHSRFLLLILALFLQMESLVLRGGGGVLIAGECVGVCKILTDMQGDSAHHGAAAGRASSRGVPAVFRGLWIEGN